MDLTFTCLAVTSVNQGCDRLVARFGLFGVCGISTVSFLKEYGRGFTHLPWSQEKPALISAYSNRSCGPETAGHVLAPSDFE